ncbi:MAG: hypothetical protein KKH88_03615 [Nanoarchaeota archaeon]|nr:hypothetical protein [Nanoarchaeota archaeon]
MNHKKIINSSKKEIIKDLGNNLISLYLVGTSVTSEKAEDIDIFAIVKKPIKNEEEIIKELTKKYKIKIGFRTITYKDLIGKTRKSTMLTKIGIFNSSILLKVLEKGKLLYGKKLQLRKLIKDDPKKDIKFEISKLKLYLKIMKERKKLPFPKTEFPKFVAYLARAELYYKTGKFCISYNDLAKALKGNHVIHDCLAIRNGKKKITKKFLNKVILYIRDIMILL